MLSKVKIWMVGLALVAIGGVAVAAGPGSNSNCFSGFSELNLTPDQKTKLTAMQEKNWKEMIPLRNEMQTKKLEMRTLWTVPNPDKDKILAKQKELGELRDKMQARATDFQIEARKVLTPEQAAQVGTFGPGMGLQGGPGMGFQGGGKGFGNGPRMGRQGSFARPCGGGFGPGAGNGPGSRF